ncbi:TraR/DksA C4-type zinc finger protein [Pseudalkalibacillus salsuginis]|uniref:TraR/DksA C4-type zinc finger protein n=1 Tax=Pseudalkalibacillus salsuginis TaxID=2910972 RepID=UPI001F3D1ED5|nr:TraR/DksA C4-type zinc finger protein [Pseudalkalibacillus salsuginis]MCF6410492.1 TraR/DksA C4-type zinc finger protein [Pseudalkalibacillus salsuginis]
MNYEHLKKQLEERKRRILQEFDQNDHYGLNRGFASDTSSGELSQYDNHPADSGTELYEREKDIALNGHLKEELSDIEYSLNQMKNGTYGICEVTGKEIPMERLEAIPTARTVKEATPNQEISSDRPIEEEVLTEMEDEYYSEHDNNEFNTPNVYYEVASFNENSMTYEDASIVDEEDNTEYVEEYEQFVSTDIEGYTGTDHVNFERNVEYDEFMDEQDQLDDEQS